MTHDHLSPTFGSLFAGIGGLDLGFELAGFECRWQVELDPFARAVLERHWPDVRRHDDIRTWPTADAELVDVIVGGFPCQPVSLAGKGLAQADPRWLWPEFRRVVAGLRPAWVVIENVPGLRRRGLRGVLADLAALGFDAEWTVLSARDVGAPHLRKRIFVAASDASRVELREQPGWLSRACWQVAAESRNDAAVGPLADADSKRQLQPQRIVTNERGRIADSGEQLSNADSFAQDRVAESRRQCNQWNSEPDVGRVAHGVPARVDRLRTLGNAVVPQAGEVIARAIRTTWQR